VAGMAKTEEAGRVLKILNQNKDLLGKIKQQIQMRSFDIPKRV